MNASERIAARITPSLQVVRMQGYELDPITIITVIIGIARLLIMLWDLWSPDAVRKQLTRALDPKWYQIGAKRARANIAAEVRSRLPGATEADVDTFIRELAESHDYDLVDLIKEAKTWV